MIKNYFTFGIIGILLLNLSNCKNGKDDEPNDKKDTSQVVELPYEATYQRSEIQANDEFELKYQEKISYHLSEASGLVSSRVNKDLVYTHEDSGNRAVVYAYDKNGQHKGDFILINIQNRDWEDIAIGPGPEEGKTYIYVADFGDNNQAREELRIHYFEEPKVDEQASSPFSLEITNISTILYRYPDGPKDAETLLINPFNKSLIIVTKRDVMVRVYELPFPQAIGEVLTPTFMGALPLRTVVAGDISADGKHILLKTYNEIYYWKTANNNPIKTLFEQIPTSLAYEGEVQGEAIAWNIEANGYFTLSETDNGRAEPILFYYAR